MSWNQGLRHQGSPGGGPATAPAASDEAARRLLWPVPAAPRADALMAPQRRLSRRPNPLLSTRRLGALALLVTQQLPGGRARIIWLQLLLFTCRSASHSAGEHRCHV